MNGMLQVLDTRVQIDGPADVVGPILAAYSRFMETPAERPPDWEVRVTADPAGPILAGGKEHPPVAGMDRTFQVYQCFLRELLSRIRGYAMLHGASLRAPNGTGILLAAPAGHGKSSLALELAARGYPLLGDDYAALDLDSRRLHPYPRATALFPDGAVPLPPGVRRHLGARAAPTLLGKVLVDVEECLGVRAVTRDPVPLGTVVLLTTGESAWTDPDAVTWVDLVVPSREAPMFDSELRQLDGIALETSWNRAGVAFRRLRVNPGGGTAAALDGLFSDEKILYLDKHWKTHPRFDSTPEMVPVARSEAAAALGRDLLNRRGGSGVLESHGGNLTAVFFGLVGALQEVACWRMTVGRLQEMADRIEGLTGRRQGELVR